MNFKSLNYIWWFLNYIWRFLCSDPTSSWPFLVRPFKSCAEIGENKEEPQAKTFVFLKVNT